MLITREGPTQSRIGKHCWTVDVDHSRLLIHINLRLMDIGTYGCLISQQQHFTKRKLPFPG